MSRHSGFDAAHVIGDADHARRDVNTAAINASTHRAFGNRRAIVHDCRVGAPRDNRDRGIDMRGIERFGLGRPLEKGDTGCFICP